jgi:hypothetical protein
MTAAYKDKVREKGRQEEEEWKEGRDLGASKVWEC